MITLHYATSTSRLISIPFDGSKDEALEFAKSLGAVVAVAEDDIEIVQKAEDGTPNNAI